MHLFINQDTARNSLALVRTHLSLKYIFVALQTIVYLSRRLFQTRIGLIAHNNSAFEAKRLWHNPCTIAIPYPLDRCQRSGDAERMHLKDVQGQGAMSCAYSPGEGLCASFSAYAFCGIVDARFARCFGRCAI
jgi:hypothetical protein